MKDSDSEEKDPISGGKTTVAVVGAKQRRLLARWLREQGIAVESLAASEALADGGAGSGADLLVISSEALEAADDEDARRLLDDQSAQVLVVSDDADPVERAELTLRGAAAVLRGSLPAEELGPVVQDLAEAAGEPDRGAPEESGAGGLPSLADFASRSASMRDLVDVVRRVADAEATLLVQGETGVGKGRLARAVHEASARSEGPFVAVNCGAMPEGLLDSELFGHEPGAFTGARARRVGRFEEAAGGTLFLDEIGEMPPHLQVKLLNVIQHRELRRLGGSELIHVDVRLIAATNRDLAEDVRSGRFRQDLFYRLNVVPLRIPPLRERREDIPELVGSLLRHLRDQSDRPDLDGVDEEALAVLQGHDWPGNVRELLNVLERAVLLCQGRRIGRDQLPEELLDPRASPRPTDTESSLATWSRCPPSLLARPLREAKDEVSASFEKAYLSEQLAAHAGRIGETAQACGISTRSLHGKMKRHGLRKEDYR